MKYIAFLLILIGLTQAGCGHSSTGSSNTFIQGYTASTCTSSTSSGTASCIPNLGVYGSNVAYEGTAFLTNTKLAQNFINSFLPGSLQATINPNLLQTAVIMISLTSNNSGPYISMAVQFPSYSNQWYSGYTTFVPNPQSSNPNVGQIMMQSNTSSFAVSSLEPWDGSYNYMAADTILISQQNAGSVGLNRTQ